MEQISDGEELWFQSRTEFKTLCKITGPDLDGRIIC